MDRAQQALTLAKCEMFAGFDQDSLEELATHAMVVYFDRGDRVFSAGEATELTYVIETGAVRIFVHGKDEEMTVGVLGPGETFGEMGLLDAGPRVASAEAMDQTVVLAVRRSDVIRLLGDRDVAGALLAALGSVVRRRAGEGVECLFLDLEGRVARLLLMLAGTKDVPRDGDTVDLAESQGEIALMVNGSRQRVNQALGGLQALGYIALDKEVIVLTDVAGLQSRVELSA